MKRFILPVAVLGLGVLCLFASTPTPTPFVLGGKLPTYQAPPSPTPKPQGSMEFFGMGPEMFENRSVAWVKAVAAMLKEAIAELGLIAVGIVLMIKNIKSQADIKEVKDRQDRQGERIDKVALAVPSMNGEPQEVKVVNDPAKPEEKIPVVEMPKQSDTPTST